MGVERLAHRHRRRPNLPVADGHVVGDRVAGDHVFRLLGRHVPAALADDDRELALVIEQARDARHVNVIVRPDHAGDLLVEEDRELRRLHAALGDVVGVVEPDRQELPGLDRRKQPDLVERVFIVLLTIDDLLAFDHAVTRAAVCLESAELHWGLPSFPFWWAAR